MEYLQYLEKGVWYGFAALGFSILFNVPQRTLFTIFFLGFIGGITKLILLQYGFTPTLSTLGGSVLIGISTIQAAHSKHAPPLVFSIPAVIPMVPGVYAYRMMLGIIELASNPTNPDYSRIISETISNGLNMFFILLAIAVGSSLPLLISRKESIKDLKLIKK